MEESNCEFNRRILGGCWCCVAMKKYNPTKQSKTDLYAQKRKAKLMEFHNETDILSNSETMSAYEAGWGFPKGATFLSQPPCEVFPPYKNLKNYKPEIVQTHFPPHLQTIPKKTFNDFVSKKISQAQSAPTDYFKLSDYYYQLALTSNSSSVPDIESSKFYLKISEFYLTILDDIKKVQQKPDIRAEIICQHYQPTQCSNIHRIQTKGQVKKTASKDNEYITQIRIPSARK